MPPLRLVLDTNVLVSAALKRQSLPSAVLALTTTKSFRLYVSKPILLEYEVVLRREELAIRRGDQLQILQMIENAGHLVNIFKRIQVCSDPDDDKFLECAEAARADYLITGNSKHFPPKWKGTRVANAREFLDAVGPGLSS